MSMTSAESQWLARVMLTISHVALGEPCNAVETSVRKGAAEEVLRAAQSFIQVLQYTDVLRSELARPVPADRDLCEQNSQGS
jgi:hypothetical protein